MGEEGFRVSTVLFSSLPFGPCFLPYVKQSVLGLLGHLLSAEILYRLKGVQLGYGRQTADQISFMRLSEERWFTRVLKIRRWG